MSVDVQCNSVQWGSYWFRRRVQHATHPPGLAYLPIHNITVQWIEQPRAIRLDCAKDKGGYHLIKAAMCSWGKLGQVVELHFKSLGSNLTVGASHQALQCKMHHTVHCSAWCEAWCIAHCSWWRIGCERWATGLQGGGSASSRGQLRGGLRSWALGLTLVGFHWEAE